MADETLAPDQVGARFVEAEQNILHAMLRGTRRAALRAERAVVERTPVNTGLTRAAWRVQLRGDGAELINDAPHAAILELGSRKHRPPYLPILRWLVQKEGGGVIEDPSQATPEQRSAAWAVVEHIARHGTKPYKMVGGALPQLRRDLGASLREHLAFYRI